MKRRPANRTRKQGMDILNGIGQSRVTGLEPVAHSLGQLVLKLHEPAKPAFRRHGSSAAYNKATMKNRISRRTRVMSFIDSV